MKNRVITAGIHILAVLGLVLAASGTALALPAASIQASRTGPSITYDELTAREWALIVKDPDAHDGEHYVVYGVVTQSDSATGAETIRANVDGIRHAEAYEYPTNTVLTGDAKTFAEVVVDDKFAAKVEVSGSISYENQLGGETTAPLLHVDSVDVLSPV
ncbi:hypothetical protein [Streptomyces sp. PA5.6]|uniref:hypothetical protein n=1 Tax=Streptomyces sp. PA5.6 TaxID=3035651 RepID=UPI0039048AF8